MFGIVGYTTFLVSSIVLNLTPGVDTVYILTKAIAGGRRVGVASALGISSGILIHTLLASLGLSIVLAQSAMAFNVVKCVGAAYLVFMGVRMLFSKQDLIDVQADSAKFEPSAVGSASSCAAPCDMFKIYRQGVLTNALNPKVALFFLALLPQFVSPSNAFGPLPFMLLGLSFCMTSTIWSLVLASVSAGVSGVLRSRPSVQKIVSKAAGCVYVLLGLTILQAKSEA